MTASLSRSLHISGKPLVTFAVLSYNQEDFIQEAIDGAFSQDYEPLEIIFSDDRSTDKTFSIISAAAANYQGPHRIIVRQSLENRGLLQHLREIVAEARGQILVLAAGDDISLPHRTTHLVGAYLNGAEAAYSSYDLIDKVGGIIRRNQRPLGSSLERLPWLREFHSPHFVYGSTSSYLLEIAKDLPKTNLRVMSEDTPLNIILQIQNRKIDFVDLSLVRYRQHENSISNSRTEALTLRELISSDLFDQKRSQMNEDLLTYILDNFAKNNDSFFDAFYLIKEITFFRLKRKWREMLFLDRLKFLMHYPDFRTFRWCALRLFGSRQYAIINAVFKSVRRKRIVNIK